jgi:hypothetical protein
LGSFFVWSRRSCPRRFRILLRCGRPILLYRRSSYTTHPALAWHGESGARARLASRILAQSSLESVAVSYRQNPTDHCALAPGGEDNHVALTVGHQDAAVVGEVILDEFAEMRRVVFQTELCRVGLERRQ